MRKLSLFLLLFPLTLSAQDAPAPRNMLKMQVRLQSPNIAPGSFLLLPKTIYRAGTRYCRVEEAEDTVNGIHDLIITNEPDAWLINLVTKTSQHVVDPGPTFNCRLPIFVGIDPKDDAANLLHDLEFGTELQFFKQAGVEPHKGIVMDGKQTMQYQIQVGQTKIALFTYDASGVRPLAIGLVSPIRQEVYFYTSYGQLPFDLALFTLPDGLSIKESPTQHATPHP